MIKLEIKYRENDDDPGRSRIKRITGENLKQALIKLNHYLYLFDLDEDALEKMDANAILGEIDYAQESNYAEFDGELDVILYIKNGDTNQMYLEREDIFEDPDNEW